MLTRDEAWELLCRYNEEPFHRAHARTVEGVMRYFAKQLGYDEAYWGQVGLLHDIDFERWPDEHCVKCHELLEAAGVEETMIRSCASHGYGQTGATIPPEHIMEKILFATDELTGLIGAAALMRPSKNVSDMELKSLKKKFKTPAFAAGCSRETITKGAELLGWELDDLLQKTLDAMKALEAERD